MTDGYGVIKAILSSSAVRDLPRLWATEQGHPGSNINRVPGRWPVSTENLGGTLVLLNGVLVWCLHYELRLRTADEPLFVDIQKRVVGRLTGKIDINNIPNILLIERAANETNTGTDRIL